MSKLTKCELRTQGQSLFTYRRSPPRVIEREEVWEAGSAGKRLFYFRGYVEGAAIYDEFEQLSLPR